ncbi:MAG: ribonuclease III [Patescibacteria group bacterium]|nr:ribonuclease III [Patescibacteria group bacterium]
MKAINLNLPEIKNQQLRETAFTHRSFLNENKKNSQSNERLEFFGDAILSFVVSQYLYRKYPYYSEGKLTDLRTALVNRETLAKVARKLGLGLHLKMSRGEERSGGRNSDALLANTFEAFIAALFFDQGLDIVAGFLTTHLLPLAEEYGRGKNLKDFKSILQEKTQEKEKHSPLYRVLNQTGPDHAKTFEIGVYLNDRLLAKGVGPSKHKGELAAAKKALENYT